MEAIATKERPAKTTFTLSMFGEKETTLTPSDFESTALIEENYKDGMDLIYAWDGPYHLPDADGTFLGYYVE